MRRPEGFHLRKRGDFYSYDFTVAGNRVRESTGQRDHGEAQKVAAIAYAEALRSAGLPVPAQVRPAVDLADLAGFWLAELEATADQRNPEYVRHAEMHIRNYVLCRWTWPREVSAEAWARALEDWHAEKTRQGERTSWAWLQRVTSSARKFLVYAERVGAIERAPRLPSPDRRLSKAEEAPRRALTPTERNKILRAMNDDEARRWYTVAFYSALRKSQINRMTLRWVNLKAKTIAIPARGSKNKEPYVTDLHPKAVSAIRAQLAALKVVDPDAPIFGAKNHRRAWRTAVKAAKVDAHGLTAHHTTRHTRLTQVGETGGLMAVMGLGGHLTIAAAQRYLHPTLEHARRANRKAR